MCDSYPTQSKDAAKREAEYRAEDDHRTLSRAEEVKADPSRMSGVKKHHAKVSKSLGAVGRSLRRKR